MRRLCLIYPLILATVIGCSHGGNVDPVMPGNDKAEGNSPQLRCTELSQSNHYTWGAWIVKVSADHSSVDLVPLRSAAWHFNLVQMLEDKVYPDCLAIENIRPASPRTLWIDVVLRNPFSDLNLTAFDVRGIFIAHANHWFPEINRVNAFSDDLPWILNPDGYTSLFNPVDFPQSPGARPIFSYTHGDVAKGGSNLTANVNPFVAYWTDVPRRPFLPEVQGRRTIELQTPEGPFSFGYAVSACWYPPGKHVVVPEIDFPPEANSLEAYSVDAQIWPQLEPTIGCTADVYVEVFDYQGKDTIKEVTIECPEVFPSVQELQYLETTPQASFMYHGTIANQNATEYGDYQMLVRVEDTASDPNLGPLSAWWVETIRMREGMGLTWGGSAGAGSDYANHLAIDSQNNVIVAGSSASQVDLDPGPGVNPGYPNSTYVMLTLSKLNQRGELEWAATWGLMPSDETYPSVGIGDICVDSSDAVYVTGTFHGVVDFDGGPDVLAVEALGLTASYLCKYDSSGDFLWVKTWSGDTAVDEYPEVRSFHIAFDGAGSVYILGAMRHSWADLDPGPGVVGFYTGDNYQSSLTYLSRFDLEGNLVWARAWGNIAYSDPEALAVSESGEVFVHGYYQSTIDLDPGPGEDIHSAMSGPSAYLSRFDSDGNYLGAIVWDYDSSTGGSREAHSLSLDGTEGIYIEGSFSGAIDFIPGPGKLQYFSTGAHLASFLIKLDYDGEFQWGKAWVNAEMGTSQSAALSPDGNICVVGDLYGTFGLDPPSGMMVYRTGVHNNWDSWLAIYGPEGNFMHGLSWGGQSYQSARDIAVDHAGRIYACGGFGGVVDLDPGMLRDDHESGGPTDAFLMRLGPDGVW